MDRTPQDKLRAAWDFRGADMDYIHSSTYHRQPTVIVLSWILRYSLLPRVQHVAPRATETLAVKRPKKMSQTEEALSAIRSGFRIRSHGQVSSVFRFVCFGYPRICWLTD